MDNRQIVSVASYPRTGQVEIAYDGNYDAWISGETPEILVDRLNFCKIAVNVNDVWLIAKAFEDMHNGVEQRRDAIVPGGRIIRSNM